MDIASGIYSTAKALGINPIDLATAISYETSGTFNPLSQGLETQFGQHRGLIQFGEPQAQQYGVSFETRPQRPSIMAESVPPFGSRSDGVSFVEVR